jgi:hypothetical protein
MAIAELLDDQQLHLGQVLQDRESQAGLGFGQQVNGTSRGKKPHLLALLAGTETQRRG